MSLGGGGPKEATIVPVMVLGCDGSGSTGYVIAGVEWAIADLAAHPGTRGVISMSLGGGGYSPAYDAAIRAAHDAGIPAVAAAGNDGIDQCDASPLTEPKSIVVGASDSSDARVYNFGACVDVFAPGARIYSAHSQSDAAYAVYSGTSMATPAVAGFAATLLAHDANMSATHVADSITCLSTKGALTDIPFGTLNQLLFAGAAIADEDCINGGPRPPPAPPQAPWDCACSTEEHCYSGDSSLAGTNKVPPQPPRCGCAEHLLAYGSDAGYFCYAAQPTLCPSAAASSWANGAAYRECSGASPSPPPSLPSPPPLAPLVVSEVRVTADQWPLEVYWELYCDGLGLVASAWGAASGAPYSATHAVFPGSCNLTLMDTWGDGR